MRRCILAALCTLSAIAALAAAVPGREFEGEYFLIAVVEPADVPGGFREPLFSQFGARRLFEAPASGASAGFVDPDSVKAWYVIQVPQPAGFADPEDRPSPWDRAHDLVDGSAGGVRLFDDPEAAAPIVEVEPSLLVYDPGQLERGRRASEQTDPCGGEGSPVPVICSRPSPHWPGPAGLFWHTGEEYTQIDRARKLAEPRFDTADPAKNVLVVHIDTGYDPNAESFLPRFFDKKASRSFLPGECGAEDRSVDKFLTFPGHGPATLSVLAGSRVEIKDGSTTYDTVIGGAPLARVVSYRVSNSVLHFYPHRLVAALAAAVEAGADVVSMAAGGTPSAALRDVVDRAYENGTALFFASGDFFQTPVPWLRTPHTTVYPARFNRAVSVVGATAEEKGYGLNPPLWSLVRNGQWSSWMTRGSWGPRSVMGHSIASYTPNITAHRMVPGIAGHRLTMSFAGTSAATPQVAAAGALWLQVHKGALQDKWRSWEKAESVYSALFSTARRSSPEYFGQGILRAADALGKTPSVLELKKRGPSRVGFDWLSVIACFLPRTESDASAAARAAHQRMIATELTQLMEANGELRRIVHDAALDDGRPPDPRTKQRLAAAVLRDPRSSLTLRDALTNRIPCQ